MTPPEADTTSATEVSPALTGADRVSRLDDSLLPGLPSQLGTIAGKDRGGYRPRARRTPRMGRYESQARRAGTSETRSFSFSMPSSLAQRWKNFAAEQRMSQVDVVFAAVNANHKRLEELVLNRQLAERRQYGVPPGEIFAKPLPPQPGHPADPTVTVAVRMLADNVAVLDRLVAQSGAVSRSQMVAVCLEAYLEAYREQRNAPGESDASGRQGTGGM